MPDIGYQSPSGDGEQSGVTLRGNVITMPEAGAAGVTLTFRIFDNASTAGDSVKAGIFNSSNDALIAESAVRTDITTEGEYTFSGGGLSSFTPANATTYFICVLANSLTIRVVFDNVASPGGISVSDQDTSPFGPPMAFSAFGSALNDTRSVIGYMTYTSAGGGTVNTSTLSDSLQVTDMALTFYRRMRELASSLAVTDAAIAELLTGNILFRVLTDSLDVSDEALKSCNRNRLLSDLLALSDETLSSAHRFVILSDALVIHSEIVSAFISQQTASPIIRIGFDQPQIVIGGYGIP